RAQGPIEGKIFSNGDNAGIPSVRSTVGESGTTALGGQGAPGESTSIPMWTPPGPAAGSGQLPTPGEIATTGDGAGTPSARSSVGQSARGVVGGEGTSGASASIPARTPPASAGGPGRVPPPGDRSPTANTSGTLASGSSRTDEPLDHPSSGDVAGTSRA